MPTSNDCNLGKTLGKKKNPQVPSLLCSSIVGYCQLQGGQYSCPCEPHSKKNLNLEAKTDIARLCTLSWKEKCQHETTDGRWHWLLGSPTLCCMPRGPRMSWQCPPQQTPLACFPTVTPAGDLDYLAASTAAQPGCQSHGVKHATRTPPLWTPSAACMTPFIYPCARQ